MLGVCGTSLAACTLCHAVCASCCCGTDKHHDLQTQARFIEIPLKCETPGDWYQAFLLQEGVV